VSLDPPTEQGREEEKSNDETLAWAFFIFFHYFHGRLAVMLLDAGCYVFN